MAFSTPASQSSNYFVHTLLRARDWQHRPEFERVCDWWRDGGKGVCGLVGMGGAGKTAIADRLVQVLPGVMPQNPLIQKDATLPAPNSTFVFSFYDAPNAEAFFEALNLWLADSPSAGIELSYSQLIRWMQNAEGLIILDGLERVQEDGTRGILGQLSAPNLRDFVNRAANGYFPRLSLLLTTRFPLADLQETQPDFFTSIPIEEIDIPTGMSLLRQRGVQGNDLELEHIVKECGCHALTVDLAGGYIKEYGGGDPNTSLTLGTAKELEEAAQQEQDPAKRAVLKQSLRFARVAQRYQEAMLAHDPAAIALLERICLFRLGVEAATLAAIFTGEDAVTVAGAALAVLDTMQLQRKLDWLVRMRIIEETSFKRRKDSQTRTLYNIHPAVRDGFFRGIGRDIASASHEAIRTRLEVSLGDAPGTNPADPGTLDLLEEIVYHAIASGQVQEAWSDIYENRMGQYQNLGYRLGAYERGDRICRAFGGGQSPATMADRLREPHSPEAEPLPCLALTAAVQAVFINEWALYLSDLGRLDAAARCYEAASAMAMQQEDWKNASAGNLNLSEVRLSAGQLRLALAIAEEALRLAEQADDAEGRRNSYSLQGTAHGLLGARGEALEAFGHCLHWQHQTDGNDDPFYSNRGIQYTLLLTRLGRHNEAQRLTEANREILRQIVGPNNFQEPPCNLILADLAPRSDVESACSFYDPAHNWALARDSKETLCWAALIKARIELAEDRSQKSGVSTEPLQTAQDALTEGLKLARDCGFGIYHIDLLLEQAHLHLLQGQPQAALADLRLALDDGLSASDQTGQPALLAALDPDCGYAWGIVEGLHRRAEALLLQAAQLHGAKAFTPTLRNELAPEVQTLIAQANACLTEAMARWRDLRDPEVSESNFIHPDTGEEHNYRAADTYQVQQDLQGGLLTRYPFSPPTNHSSEADPQPHPIASAPMTPAERPASVTSPRVLISYSHDSPAHAAQILQLSNRLRTDGVDCYIDQYVPNPSEGWPLWMDNQVEAADFVLIVFTERYTTRSLTPRQSGVRFESVLLLQSLYEMGMINDKFIPVLLEPSDAEHIMKWFRPYNHYAIHTDTGYDLLLRRLLDDPAVVPPPLGTPTRRGPVN